MKFAEKLARLIDAGDKSQSRLAVETGIHQTAISGMTRGLRKPYLWQGLALARALGVSLDYLADDALDEPVPLEAGLSQLDQTMLTLIRRIGHAEVLARITERPVANPPGEAKPGHPFEPVKPSPVKPIPKPKRKRG